MDLVHIDFLDEYGKNNTGAGEGQRVQGIYGVEVRGRYPPLTDRHVTPFLAATIYYTFLKFNYIIESPSSGDAGFIVTGGFDEESEGHEEVVVALRGIQKEVHGLAGAVIRFSLFHLVPELLIFRRGIGGIHLERTGVDGSKEIEAELGLGWGGEGKGQNAPAKRLLEERGNRLTDAGSIDHHAAAVPDVLEEVDELGV